MNMEWVWDFISKIILKINNFFLILFPARGIHLYIVYECINLLWCGCLYIFQKVLLGLNLN